MPRYSFVVQLTDQSEEVDARAMNLPNDRAALHFAERTITGLKKEKGYRPIGFVIVRNEMNEAILSVPFFPACA
jgi:hypothetical protein